MKKAIAFAVLILAVAWAGPAQAQISNTDHDFSGKSWNTGGEICQPCHVPHNADTSVSDAPLWNHAVTTQTFTKYASGTLDATIGTPSGTSKLCLSCHDGVTALDSFGGTTGTTTMSGNAAVGTDLSDDHPVSFTYNAALASTDGDLVSPSGGSVGTLSLPLFGGSTDQLECATCHSVHDDANSKFLRADNAGSALCLNCHSK